MRIDVIRYGGGSAPFAEFLESNGLRVEVRERSITGYATARFYAHLPGVEVMDRGMFRSSTESGDSPELAVRKLAKALQGERVAIDAYKPERREVDVPNELTFPEGWSLE